MLMLVYNKYSPHNDLLQYFHCGKYTFLNTLKERHRYTPRRSIISEKSVHVTSQQCPSLRPTDLLMKQTSFTGLKTTTLKQPRDYKFYATFTCLFN